MAAELLKEQWYFIFSKYTSHSKFAVNGQGEYKKKSTKLSHRQISPNENMDDDEDEQKPKKEIKCTIEPKKNKDDEQAVFLDEPCPGACTSKDIQITH